MGTYNSDLTSLTINAIIWIITSVFLIKRYSYKNSGVIVVIFYTIISLFAIDLYVRRPNGTLYPWSHISIIPLLLLLIFIVLFSLLIIKASSYSLFKRPSKKFITIIAISVSILSLLNIYEIINNFSTGLMLLATDSDYGNEIYSQTTEKFIYNFHRSDGVNIIGTLSTLAKKMAPMIFLIYLSYRKKNKLLLIALALSTFTSYMYSVSMGMRSAIIQDLLSIILFYIFIKRFYSKRTIYWFNRIVGCFLGIIICGMILITISRVNAHIGGRSSVYENAESYASQGIIYLGAYGLDNGNEIRNGDRTFPLIKSIFSDDVARDVMERRLKYNKMKINDSVFCTFVGDFIFDYGIIGGTFVLFILYLIYKGLLKGYKRSIDFSQIIIIYLLSYMLVGFYLYPLDGYAGNIFVISIILLSISYKLFYNGKNVLE